MERIIKGPDLTSDHSEHFVEALLKKMRKPGHAKIMVFQKHDHHITHHSIVLKAATFAESLKAELIAESDVVCTLCDVCPEFPPIMLGTMLNGSAIFPLHPRFGDSEILSLFNISKPKLIVTQNEYMEKIQNLLPKFKYPVKLMVLEDLEEYNEADLDYLLKYPGCSGSKFLPLILTCSSGTSGLQKAVVHTAATMRVYFKTVLCVGIKILKKEVHLQAFHYTWITGLLAVLSSFFFGYTLVCLEEYEPQDFLSTIQKYKVTHVLLPPHIVLALADCCDLNSYDISSIHLIRVGGNTMSAVVEGYVRGKLGVELFQVYGMTECPLVAQGGSDSPPGSVGHLFPGVEAKVCNLETSKPVGPNVPGELFIRSPLKTPGYYGDIAATTNLFTEDGWMHTGDVVYYDEHENFYVVDRLKEFIKYKGFQVLPEEIISVLKTHPDVDEAVVVGVKDLFNEENATAFIVKKENSQLTEDVLVELVKEKLPEHKWLHGGVLFVAEIPRTLNGKVRRGELRVMAMREARLHN